MSSLASVSSSSNRLRLSVGLSWSRSQSVCSVSVGLCRPQPTSDGLPVAPRNQLPRRCPSSAHRRAAHLGPSAAPRDPARLLTQPVACRCAIYVSVASVWRQLLGGGRAAAGGSSWLSGTADAQSASSLLGMLHLHAQEAHLTGHCSRCMCRDMQWMVTAGHRPGVRWVAGAGGWRWAAGGGRWADVRDDSVRQR